MLGGDYTLKFMLGDSEEIFTKQLTFLDLRENQLFITKSNLLKRNITYKNFLIFN